MAKRRKFHPFRLVLVLLVPLLLVTGIIGGISLLRNKEEPVSEKKVTKKETISNASIEAFLKHSLEPMGSTMYIWGGGWNKSDTGAGKEAKTIGISKTWKTFAQKQDASYDFNNYLYQIHDGLDCSGYVGWMVYNTMETENNKAGFVTESGNMIQDYTDRGWGKRIPANQIEDYKPGDILANDSHVYVVWGQYGDGSVLLAHSSPPGVRLCGTPTLDGNVNSEAIQSAKKIMAREFPTWYAKYPDCTADYSYLTSYDQFRWNTKTMKDAKTMQKLSARQVVNLLFE